MIENAEIRVEFIPSEMQIANILTEALPNNSFRRLRESMSMRLCEQGHKWRKC